MSAEPTTRRVASGFSPADRMAGMRPYSNDPPEGGIDLWLDANEGRPASASEESFDPELARRYQTPDRLEADLAQRIGVAPERVVVTAGGDDAIQRLCQIAVQPGRAALLHTPTFVMIERGVRLAGGRVDAVAWERGPFPLESFMDGITNDTSLVSLVSPNNPTGLQLREEELLEVAKAARDAGALLLADLAYVEFASHDPTPALLECDNAVVVRTFSKAFGLAGLRVGYALASSEVASWLRASGSPFPVAGPSLAAATHALALGCQKCVRTVRLERAELAEQLRGAGLEVPESEGNFVLVRTPLATELHAALAGSGIAVRRYPVGSSLGDALRITLPANAEHFDRLTRSIASALDAVGS